MLRRAPLALAALLVVACRREPPVADVALGIMGIQVYARRELTACSFSYVAQNGRANTRTGLAIHPRTRDDDVITRCAPNGLIFGPTPADTERISSCLAGWGQLNSSNTTEGPAAPGELPGAYALRCREGTVAGRFDPPAFW